MLDEKIENATLENIEEKTYNIIKASFKNAKTFSDKGAAVILEEKYLSGAILYENICNIVFNKKRLSEMEKASASTYNRNCAEDICEEILKMI